MFQLNNIIFFRSTKSANTSALNLTAKFKTRRQTQLPFIFLDIRLDYGKSYSQIWERARNKLNTKQETLCDISRDRGITKWIKKVTKRAVKIAKLGTEAHLSV